MEKDKTASFTITGQVCEKESGIGVPGLIVESRDKESRYNAIVSSTDNKGHFKIIYTKKASRELFEKKPNIVLSIYSPPRRLLMKTKECIRLGVSKEEHLNLEIPRAILGHNSPILPEDRVEVAVKFSMDQLTIEKRGNYDIPHMPAFKSYGSPGSPSLLEQIQYVALPLNAKVLGLEILPGDPVRLPGPFNPYPVQLPIRTNNQNSRKEQNIDSLAGHYVMPSFISLDSKYGDNSLPYPEKLAVLLNVSRFSGINVAMVSVCPFQYDPGERALLVYPNLQYILKYEPAPLRRLQDNTSIIKLGKHKAEHLQLFLNKSNVSSAKNIFHHGDIESIFVPPPIELKVDIPYVIITDDYEWRDNVKGNRVVADESGNSVTYYFEQLAKWKTQRGMRTRVVTVSDIVSGNLGNYAKDTKSGYQTRDLQEVIRNFIKHIHWKWGTQFVLLGGNRNIVPMRYLIAYKTTGTFWSWDFTRSYDGVQDFINFGEKETIPPRGCKFDENEKKTRLCCDGNLNGDLGQEPNSSLPLSTCSGVRIPFKSTPGDGKLGWYFADEQFKPLPGQETASWYPLKKKFIDANPGTSLCNLIVEGDSSKINDDRGRIDDDYYWGGGDHRLVPSDFYYRVLSRKDVETIPPQLGDEFDFNGNGLYGQFRCDFQSGHRVWTPVDNFNPNADICVGRAPVETAADAKNFVDKIITYETLEYSEDGSSEKKEVDRAYLKRIVLGAHLWDLDNYETVLSPASFEIEDQWGEIPRGQFVQHSYLDMIGGWPLLVTVIEMHLPERFSITTNPNPSHHLILRFNQDDALRSTDFEVPHKDGDTKWYFIEKQFGNQFDGPSEYIRIEGPMASVKPNKIVWNPAGIEGASGDKEALRLQMGYDFPLFGQVFRFYADYMDLSWPPHIEPLRVASIRSAIDNGCHFLSLSGHGDPAGCCGVICRDYGADKKFVDPDFQNENRYFIAYADSCYTARPDVGSYPLYMDEIYKTLGERTVLYPKGGAVAYIGNVVVGFTGSEQIFWKEVKNYGRLGPAIASIEDDYWQRYEQMLYGDPEMPVWTDVPKLYQIDYPQFMTPGIEITIQVCDSLGSPLEGHQVTFFGGWIDSATNPSIYENKTTGSDGKVNWTPPLSAMEVTITITPPDRSSGVFENYKPFVGNIWKSGEPCDVAGTVVDHDFGTPIEGATVTIGDKKTTTDHQGAYALIGVLSGLKDVKAKAKWYIPKTQSVKLIPSQTIIVDFALQLREPSCHGALPKEEPCMGPKPATEHY